MTMANTPAQVALDEKGLEAATAAMEGFPLWEHRAIAEAVLRAYLFSLSAEPGDDGQGALVERARYFVENPSAWESGFDQGASDRLAEILAAYDALTSENAALRRELDRYRDGLQVLATTFYKGDEHQDYAKHVLVNDAAERRLAEQGQAQGEVQERASFGAFHSFDGVGERYEPAPPSPEPDAELGQAAADVLAERRRQISAEGWTPEHDDTHDKGEIAAAAVCYAFTAVRSPHEIQNRIWPWSSEWWKPSDERRNLVKAGALLLAEIERRDRARHRKQGGE